MESVQVRSGAMCRVASSRPPDKSEDTATTLTRNDVHTKCTDKLRRHHQARATNATRCKTAVSPTMRKEPRDAALTE